MCPRKNACGRLIIYYTHSPARLKSVHSQVDAQRECMRKLSFNDFGLRFNYVRWMRIVGRALYIEMILMIPAGLEPAIPGSVGRCLIHWATGPDVLACGMLPSYRSLFRAHSPTQCYFHVPDRRVDFFFSLLTSVSRCITHFATGPDIHSMPSANRVHVAVSCALAKLQ